MLILLSALYLFALLEYIGVVKGQEGDLYMCSGYIVSAYIF